MNKRLCEEHGNDIETCEACYAEDLVDSIGYTEADLLAAVAQEEPKRVVCSKCAGTGVDDDEDPPCPRCGGSGYLLERDMVRRWKREGDRRGPSLSEMLGTPPGIENIEIPDMRSRELPQDIDLDD